MNTEKFTFGTKIRSILLKNAKIKEAVGNKIFPLIAPEDTQGSFIIYQRDRYSKMYTKMGIYEEACVIYITVVADTYDTSQQLALEINNILEGYTDGFQIRLSDSTEDYTENKFVQVLEFKID